jgi:2,4-dienoyl-CoA reductase-like NADH-dependent reductase (Old Yellow Enzyme family)
MTKFTYKTKSDLLSAAESAGVTLPWSDDLDVLRQEKRIGESGIVMKNRLTVHPMEGFDSTPDGSPSELTLRRAGRFADGGAGLIWLEATSVTEDGRTNTGQLWINEDNADEFAKMAEMMHERSGGVPLILQLTHSGRFSKPDNTPHPVISYHNPLMNEKFMIDPDYPVVTDEYLDALPEKFGRAAELAKKAGFDGVQIHGAHVNEGCFVPAAAAVAEAVSCPVMVVGGFRGRDKA